MTTSTDVHDLLARNFVAEIHPTTAFIRATEMIVNLVEHDESFRKRVDEVKQQVSRNALHPHTVALIEDALHLGNPFAKSNNLGALKPLIGTLYLRAAAGLQANGLPSDEQILAFMSDRKRFNRLKSALEKGFLPIVDLHANRSYVTVKPFRRKIDAAIGDLSLVSLTFDTYANKLNELLLSSQSEPEKAVCIFNGQRINCVVFWILVIAILLVAIIIDIFD